MLAAEKNKQCHPYPPSNHPEAKEQKKHQSKAQELKGSSGKY
jgi:hypothetical protein